MKKIPVLIMALIVFFASNLYAINDDLILRRIITDVYWNADKEIIEVHYIVIQKAPGEEVESYSAIGTIHDDSLYKEQLTDEKAKKVAQENSGLFKSDIIFGKRVPAYKNLTDIIYTQQELDNYIQLAEEEVELMFELGPDRIYEEQMTDNITDSNIANDKQENQEEQENQVDREGIQNAGNQSNQAAETHNSPETIKKDIPYSSYILGFIALLVLIILSKVVMIRFKK